MPLDLTTKEGVVEHMRSSTTDYEWSKNAKLVKEANGGFYPDFWYDTIVRSGLLDETGKRWGDPKASELKITVGDEAIKDLMEGIHTLTR